MRVLPQPVVLAAQASQHVTGVPACISLGQYGLESAWGAKVTGAFNFFGIKAKPDQPSKLCETHEVTDGVSHIVYQAFRVFGSMAEAFMAHAELLATAPVYATAMRFLPDWRAFVKAMAVHYAGDPAYAEKLILLIEQDGLQGYDVVLKAAA